MKNVAKALFVFQSKDRGQKTNAENPHFKNQYVTLDKIWDDIRADLQAVGLAVIQSPIKNGTDYGVETTLIHVESGETISSACVMPMEKTTPQGVGSCITYARRYALASMLGMTVDMDDDGNEASGNKPSNAPIKPPEHKPPTTPSNAPNSTQDASKPAEQGNIPKTQKKPVNDGKPPLAYCENEPCGKAIWNTKTIDWSKKKFDGKVFCFDCQQYYKKSGGK